MAERALVLDPATLAFVPRGAGVETLHLVTADRGARQMLNGITRIAPGAAVPEHFHNCEESIVVLTGHGFAQIAGERFEVRAQWTTLIPEGVPHFLANPSRGEALVIFWTYASIDATRTIVATGRTTRIDEEVPPGPGRETAA